MIAGSTCAAAAVDAPASDRAVVVAGAIAQLRAHSLYRDQVDWSALGTRYRRIEVDTPAWVRPDVFIQRLLVEIGDHHGFVLDRAGIRRISSAPESTPTDMRARTLTAGTRQAVMSYIAVPSTSAFDARATARYARAMRSALAQLDRAGACGYVVDLCGNPGGNMWPMLLGLQPLLGEGAVDYVMFFETARMLDRKDDSTNSFAPTSTSPSTSSAPAMAATQRSTQRSNGSAHAACTDTANKKPGKARAFL